MKSTLKKHQGGLMKPTPRGFVISDPVRASFAEPAKRARRGLLKHKSKR